MPVFICQVNAPAKAGGFGLRLKAGSISHPADGAHSSAIIPGGAPVLRQIVPVEPAPSRRIAIPGAELIRRFIYKFPFGAYLYHQSPEGEGFTDPLSGTLRSLLPQRTRGKTFHFSENPG